MTNASSPFLGRRYPGQAAERVAGGPGPAGLCRPGLGAAGSAQQHVRLRGNGALKGAREAQHLG